MNVYILTNHKNFDFVYETTYQYKNHHQVHISTQPYVILSEYDVGISFMHQHKVPAKEVNTHTWINFHPAPLPEYKGRNLCYHAIMNGEKEFGATIHYMDENFDTGDIIDVQRFVILPHYTAQDVSEIAIEMSKTQFELFFPEILAGKEFERIPNVGGTYYGKSAIPDTLELRNDYGVGQFVRAVYYPPYYPKIDIGGVIYKIVKDE